MGLLDGDDAHYDAAICAPIVATEQPGLTVLAENIGDNPGAVTRFVLVGRPGELPAPTGADKTTVVVPLPEDRPGALMEILDQFATRGVNLSRIESRPTGQYLGHYFFSIDADGHVADARVADALAGLHRISPATRFLGSYGRADGHRTVVRAAYLRPGIPRRACVGERHTGRGICWCRNIRPGLRPERRQMPHRRTSAPRNCAYACLIHIGEVPYRRERVMAGTSTRK